MNICPSVSTCGDNVIITDNGIYFVYNIHVYKLLIKNKLSDVTGCHSQVLLFHKMSQDVVCLITPLFSIKKNRKLFLHNLKIFLIIKVCSGSTYIQQHINKRSVKRVKHNLTSKMT